MGCWRRRVVCLAACAALAVAAAAQAQPDVETLLAAALDHFYNLEYPQAIAGFRRITQEEPGSAGAWNHLAQAELYQEMYRMGALESTLYGKSDAFLRRKLLPPDPAAVATISENLERAQTCAQAAIAQDAENAQAHYDLAAAWGLEANLAFSVNKAYWSALSDAKHARQQADIAHKLKPEWVDPLLIIGVQNYVAGSLPWTMKIFTSIVGYRGNRKLGLQQVAEVAEHGEHARTDAAVLLAVADRRDGNNRAAAALFARLTEQYPRNVLFAVETGEAEEAAGEHETARQTFETILKRAQAGAPGYGKAPRAQVWYDLGSIAALYSQWPEAAHDYQQAAQVPDAPPRYRQAARKAAAIAASKAGNRS